MFPDICKKLNLGKIIEYSKMTGGVTNQMYKVRTDKGAYALKIINEDILNNKESFDKIENSEII